MGSARERKPTVRFEIEEPEKKKKKRRRKKKVNAKDKKKKKKVKVVPSKPTAKPKSAYGLFAHERRKLTVLLNPEDKRGATKAISDEWKAMSEEARKEFVDRALELREAWEKVEADRIEAERLKLEKEEERKAKRRARLLEQQQQPSKRRRIHVPPEDFWCETSGEAWTNEHEWKYRAHAFYPTRRVKKVDYCDDQCSVCIEGGSLLVCSSCPRSFHSKCLEELGLRAKDLDQSGDLGGRNFTKRKKSSSSKKQKTHQPDPKAVVFGVNNDKEDDDNWHCPVCTASHSKTCLNCGEAGDAETRLIPCSKCPRAFHFRCAKLQPLFEKRGIVWQCDCESEDRDEPKGEAPSPASTKALGDAVDVTTLRKIVELCETLPRSHFGSVWGSRVKRVVTLAERETDADEATRALGAIDRLHDVDSIMSRLHFAKEQSKQLLPGEARDPASRFGANRSSMPSKEWDDAAAGTILGRKTQFALDGLCVIPGALDEPRVEAARCAAIDYYDDAMHTIAQLNLEEELQQGGFATFKSRDRGRFDLVVPSLTEACSSSCSATRRGAYDESRETGNFLDFLSSDPAKCPWLQLVRHLIGESARLCHVGVIVALSDAVGQQWHSDGDHVDDDLQLPPHALNVFVPLVDVSADNGATEFAPGSHLDWNDPRKVVLEATAGDAIVFDWRLKHRGLANRVTQPRPLLYLTYALPWFVDRYNFSSDRYDELPPLVPRTSRADRASSRNGTATAS